MFVLYRDSLFPGQEDGLKKTEILFHLSVGVFFFFLLKAPPAEDLNRDSVQTAGEFRLTSEDLHVLCCVSLWHNVVMDLLQQLLTHL